MLPQPRLLALTLCALLAPCAVSFAASPVLSHHVPAIVSSGQAVKVSALGTSEHLQLALSLPLRNQAQLEALLADLYNPASPNFHHWLSSQEFDIRFGPSRAETQTLVDWAKTNGLAVTFQATNGRVVEVNGSVDTVNRAFHITETKYHDNVLNRDFHAPDREPTTDLPFALMGIDGIEDSTPIGNHLMKDPAASLPPYVAAPKSTSLMPAPGIEGTGVARPGPRPNVSGSGPNSSYLPSDIRAAYYGTGNLDGTGQTVGIYSYDGYLTSDLTVYYQNTGMVTSVPVHNVLVGGYAGNCYATNSGTSGTCDDGEQILDIVQVQGMAPGLTQIQFYEGTNATTILNQMASDNTSKTISSSWFGGTFGTASDPAFMQMATQGQTYLNATGDDGAFNSATYGAPGLDANIVQVGGTDLVTNGPGGPWASETGWSDSGGGFWVTGMPTAAKILIPTWQSQAGVVTAANKASATYRNVPDIAAEATFDNPTADNGVFELGYGGTSFATPRMAGYVALANQQSVAKGQATLGFINPALYTAGLSASTATVYHDITTGTNKSSSGTGSYTAVAGYDLVTGWGSPNGTGLINALAGTPAADFALAPTTAVSVQRGGNAVIDSVSITPYNGFTGTVTLTSTGLPTGVTATYAAGTPTTPGGITLTAISTATPGTYNVTLSGTSGSLTHTIVVAVTVMKRASNDFTLTATSSSALQGSTSTSTITVTPSAGLAGGISLAVSNLPTGATANLSATSTTPASTAAGMATPITLTFTVPGSVTPGSYNVTVTGTSLDAIVHTATVALTVSTPPSLIVNGGFETGAAAPWVFTTVSGTEPAELLTTTSGIPPHNGNYFLLLDGGAAASVDTVTQQVAITSGNKATLGVWYWVLTGETGTTAKDTLSFQLTNTAGAVLTTLGTVSNLNGNGYWAYVSFDVSAYMGQTVVVKLTGTQAGTTYTDFLVDDVSLVVY